MKKYKNLVILLLVLAAIIYLIITKFNVFSNVILVLIGFGAVIFIHELGHFTVGKLTDMNVQAFCLGFHPLLIGVLKTDKGFRVRILPKFFPTEGQVGEEGDGKLSFTIPVKNSKAGETEYRIGMVPFGGFVKVLGQEDVGVAEVDKDPRSFINKPVSARVAMVSAGVIFNAISAIIIFMITFMIGVDLPPATVGGIFPDSPAAAAGMHAGDKILEINGKKTFDFGDVLLAGPLSGKDEPINFKVQSEDGSIKELSAVAENIPGQKLRGIGVVAPSSLKLGKPADEKYIDRLFEKTGLKPGDVVTAVNGEAVDTFWGFEEKLDAIEGGTVKITVKRNSKNSDAKEAIEVSLGFEYLMNLTEVSEPNSDSQLGNFYGMVPRLQIPEDFGKDDGAIKKLIKGLFKADFRGGDVIVGAGEIQNPTYRELRELTNKYENLKLPITVLRKNDDGGYDKVTVIATPKLDKASGKVVLGIPITLDMEHAVVARTIEPDYMEKLVIPAGTKIGSVNGENVESFNDIIDAVRRNKGEEIEVAFLHDTGNGTIGAVAKFVAESEHFNAVSFPEGDILFESLRETKKADGPVQGLGMGWKKTTDLIMTTYVTLKQLVLGLVSPEALSGPIGIVTMSYKIVSDQSLVYYLYFMALISACIAVFNFLPLPIMDGGVVVLLLIEKIKGSPISPKVQGIINYIGLALIGFIFLSVTFIDLKNLIMN